MGTSIFLHSNLLHLVLDLLLIYAHSFLLKQQKRGFVFPYSSLYVGPLILSTSTLEVLDPV